LGGPGECLFDGGPVSLLKTVAKIARSLVPDPRRSGQQGCGCIDHRCQRKIFDRDPLCSVAREFASFGDDQRHRVADMSCPPAGQRVSRRDDHRIERADLGDAG
jgi:hypothetical protein